MKRSWSQDGPKMAQERPRCAKRRGGNKCNKRYPFSTVSVTSGPDEAKIYPRWDQSGRREEAKRNPKRGGCESKQVGDRGKLGPSRSEHEATMEPKCRHHSPKEEERRCHRKPKLRRLENNMGPSRSEDEPKMAPRLEWNRKRKTARLPKPMVKHMNFAIRRGGELRKKWSQDGGA